MNGEAVEAKKAVTLYYPHYCEACYMADIRAERLMKCRFCGSDRTVNCYGERFKS